VLVDVLLEPRVFRHVAHLESGEEFIWGLVFLKQHTQHHLLLELGGVTLGRVLLENDLHFHVHEFAVD